MPYPALAIIGTAGRKEDRHRLSKSHYQRMVEAASKLITHLKINPKELKLYSGGAAWADHIVVTLALLEIVPHENVTLYLPSELTVNGYTGENEWAKKTASTANYYHRMFSDYTDQDTIQQIIEIGEHGATLVPGNGSFHSRNSLVAKAVSPDGALLAFTFGAPGINQQPWTIREFDESIKADVAGLKDGGTADTWSKAKCSKFHALIGDLDENHKPV